MPSGCWSARSSTKNWWPSSIRRSAPFDDQGQALQEKGYHYYDNDAFYTAHGRYNPIVTCNQWTRDALAEMGVRTALWSPFVQPLFWQLKK
ncbi:hypothetical protein DK842_17140 [Chromobacterium phragmitis]|uniref:DUF2459 domain-containing protein n=1 Tax=Chromobacterium phragmitis TaxID=2202141 RepID=UPI000DEC4A57|nr:hypothetical protein DK842_17140 [Chromobacterium phragmitis]